MSGIINLASYGFFGGGSFGNLLSQWQAMGVFDYVLPFLLIFAVIFGILSKIKLFTTSEGNPNKTVNAVIALAVSLMALQFDFVSRFFAELFPRVAMGLAVILVIIVLGGLFIPSNSKAFNWALIGVVVVIIAIVIFNSFQAFGFGAGSSWFSANWGTLVSIGIFLALIIAIIAGGSSKPQNSVAPKNIFLGDLEKASK